MVIISPRKCWTRRRTWRYPTCSSWINWKKGGILPKINVSVKGPFSGTWYMVAQVMNHSPLSTSPRGVFFRYDKYGDIQHFVNKMSVIIFPRQRRGAFRRVWWAQGGAPRICCCEATSGKTCWEQSNFCLQWSWMAATFTGFDTMRFLFMGWPAEQNVHHTPSQCSGVKCKNSGRSQ